MSSKYNVILCYTFISYHLADTQDLIFLFFFPPAICSTNQANKSFLKITFTHFYFKQPFPGKLDLKLSTKHLATLTPEATDRNI